MPYRLRPGSTSCTVLSIILFNLTWLSLVFLTMRGLPLAALLIVLTLAVLPFTMRQVLASLLVAIAGICIDSLLTLAGLMDFGGPLLPVWLMVLWVGFALVLHYGLGFLARLSLPLQALLGAVGGSSSYYAGMAADSVVFPQNTVLTVLVFALVWAVLLPLFFHLAVRSGADSTNQR